MAYVTLAETLVEVQKRDLSKLTAAQRKELTELLEAQKRYEDENKLLLYKPYQKQVDFHNAGATHRERLLMAANQCLSPWTFIETPEGERRIGEYLSAETGDVLALVDGQERVAQFSNAILKGIEPAFRVLLDTGRFFDCTRRHRVLTTEGWIEVDQLVSPEDGLHLTQTVEDYQASYAWGGHRHDQQPHLAEGSGQAQPPAPGDAPRGRLHFSHRDAEARTPERIRACLASGPLPIAECDPSHLAALYEQFAGPAETMSVLHTSESIQTVQRLVRESGLQLRSRGEGHHHSESSEQCAASLLAVLSPGVADTPERIPLSGRTAPRCLSVGSLGERGLRSLHGTEHIQIFFPFGCKRLVGGASIVAVVPIGYQPILDVQVVDIHNYKAAGVYHHNSGKSYSAAAEVAMHLTGIYPDWWEGKRFAKAVRGLAAGVTSQLVRDSMQVLLFGYPALELGHGMVPKKTIVGEPTMARSVQGAYDTIKVKHVSGGESSLYLRSYDAGRERVQALTLDFCWLDEEPDQTYFSEVLTRTNVAFGPVFMTFTPLKGMSDTVARFMLEGHGNVTNMTIHDVDHYTAEQKEAIIAQYPAHERDARINGIPTMGSGKVFPIAESDIAVPAFPIPDHWPRLCGMDFGWTHPTAAVWYAHDRDTDTVYVYDTYRASETTIPVVSSAIKARGDWIPVAWPHDGHAVKDANTGEQLAQQYKNQGVNMRHTHAQFPETGQEGERKMSRMSTEAGVQEMLTRMESGRFKVFDHLNLFFEELRLYHRKDGLLVKVRDDLMSASRIGIYDLRFAVTKPSPTSMIDHNRRSDPFI